MLYKCFAFSGIGLCKEINFIESNLILFNPCSAKLPNNLNFQPREVVGREVGGNYPFSFNLGLN